MILSTSGCSGDESTLKTMSALPPEIPEVMSPRQEEIPADYELIEDGKILDQLGMARNPGYITNRSETTALANRGSLCSFASVFGDDQGIALIVNGIYFRHHEDFEAFWRDQEAKERRVIGFQGPEPDGYWLVLVGCDPDREYSDDEFQKIADGISKYQKRLKLELLFDRLTTKQS